MRNTRTLLLLWSISCFVPGPAIGASAEKRSFPAKGEKTCTINQYASAHLNALGHTSSRTLPRVSVDKNGSISMSLAEDTYPGSKIYLLIDGHRYSGLERFYIPLDKTALAALKAEKVIEFTYTNWPYRRDINGSDVLEDFASAYDDCLIFLGSPAAKRPNDAGAKSGPLNLQPALPNR